MARSKTKLDPDAIYVAWQGFATTIDGTPVIIREGARLRGTEPAVKHLPQFFVKDGERILNAEAMAAERAEREFDSTVDQPRTKVLKGISLDDPDALIAVKHWSAKGGRPGAWAVIVIKPGDLTRAGSDVAESAPRGLFVPVKKAPAEIVDKARKELAGR